MERKAFVLRIAPTKVDRVNEALSSNQLIIGWAKARGLLAENLSREDFREIIQKTYHANTNDLKWAGTSAGHMWRFIREMNKNDLVVVPHRKELYVARVSGPANFDESKVKEDSAYRRPVKWLNGKMPIPRSHATPALASRMKVQGTCTDASDLLADIEEILLSGPPGAINPSWSRDELILALDLYFKEPAARENKTHSAVIELSKLGSSEKLVGKNIADS